MPRVLWFTNTTAPHAGAQHAYRGGGWISALQGAVKEQRDVELGVVFFDTKSTAKFVYGGTVCYTIRRAPGRRTPITTLFRNYRGDLVDTGFTPTSQWVVDDFKPDLIQVFGTEGPFGLLQTTVQVPIVIHLQGLLNPYMNAYFPTGSSRNDFLTDINYFCDHLRGHSPAFRIKRFEKLARREREVLQGASHVIGRTKWDRMIAKHFNTQVAYHHVDELLRPEFYESRNQAAHNPKHKKSLTILSVLSPTIYKGMDVVLRTARLLHSTGIFSFQWNVVGISESDNLVKHFQKKERVSHREVDVNFLGVKNARELVQLHLNSDVYVHPSYIDNSPNALCEAQYCGLPVIATNVGGVSSLVEDGETGLLVPANGVFEIAHKLQELACKEGLAQQLGERGAAVARQRHDPKRVVRELKKVYDEILTT